MTKTSSALFSAAVVLTLMGIGTYWGDIQLDKKYRLAEPVLTAATFVNANCTYLMRGKGSQPFLRLQYFYEPLDATSIRKVKLDATDLVGLGTIEECHKMLAVALIERKTAVIWYEKTHPTSARFSLTPRNSSVFLWIFLPLAFLFAVVGLCLRNPPDRQNRTKKFRKRKL